MADFGGAGGFGTFARPQAMAEGLFLVDRCDRDGVDISDLGDAWRRKD